MMNCKVSVGLLRALLVAILWLFVGSIVLLVGLIVLFDLLNTSLNFGRRIGDLLIHLLNSVTWFEPRWTRN